MTSKERVIAALELRQPDRVPTGENYVDGCLAETLLGEKTLYNKGWEELEALWESMCGEETGPQSPGWHEAILERRRKNIAAGDTGFMSLKQLRERLGR